MIYAMLLFVNISICTGQTNAWRNNYMVSLNDENYKFEVLSSQNYCVIKYYFKESKTKDVIKDTVIADTIKSAEDKIVFEVSVKNLLNNDTVRKRNKDPKNISSILYDKYINGKHISELEEKISLLDNGAPIGTIRLKTTPELKNVDVFSINNGSNKVTPDPSKKRSVQVSIDSVDIAFEQGVIKDILIRAKLINTQKQPIIKGPILYFTNKRYIPVRNAEDVNLLSCKGKNYLYFLYRTDSLMVLDLADVIYYDRKIPYAAGTYIPKDTTIYLKADIDNHVNLIKPSIPENFDIRVFTDVLGINGKEPNGIVQSEAQLNFWLNVGKNRLTLGKLLKLRYNKYRQQLFCFNKISPYFKLTKIEKANNSNVFIDTTSKQTNLLDMFKYAHLNVGTELNVLTYRTNSKLFTCNVAGGFFRTTIGYDSLKVNHVDKSTVYINPNLDFQFFESNKIDFNLKFGVYGAWTISPIDSFAFSKVKTVVKKYANDDSHWWGQFQQSINIHPHGRRSNSFFIRTSQYISTKNNYFTFQIGYSTSLANILNMK